jgi:acetyl-CoA synthetase
VIVVRRRAGGEGDEAWAAMTEGRDHWWHRLLDGQSGNAVAEAMDAEDLLFILYTSGTTGKPKGIVHTTGGYLTQAASTTRHHLDTVRGAARGERNVMNVVMGAHAASDAKTMALLESVLA